MKTSYRTSPIAMSAARRAAPFLALWLGLLLACGSGDILQAAEPGVEEVELWKQGDKGYHTFRIPSLLVTPKGTVLAFAEGRKNDSKDHGNLDLVMRRSTDGGKTWSDTQVVYEEGGDEEITIGNPCPVVDETTGVLWMPFCKDNKEVLFTTSTDEGLTWTEPRNLTADLVEKNWSWVATGPGVGIQLRKGPHQGRLVIPSDHRVTGPDGKDLNFSHMILSDDHGKTWRNSGRIGAGGNECQVVELQDGTLLVNTRMQQEFQGMRGIATSSDGGETWTEITHDPHLPGPRCQASLIRLAGTGEEGPAHLLFSNPQGQGPGKNSGKLLRRRSQMTVQLSEDEGKTWKYSQVLNEGPSAYSCLAELEDGTILCLYEGSDEGAYFSSIRLARFPLSWVKGN